MGYTLRHGSLPPSAFTTPYLAKMLHLPPPSFPSPKVRLQHPPKHLHQHLKTNLGNGRVIPPLAQLIPDKRVLRPRKLVPAKRHPGIAQALADEVPAGRWDVRVLDAEDEGQLGGAGWGGELREEVEGVGGGGRGRGGGVGGGVRAEGAGVDVGGEVGDAGGYAGVELGARGVSLVGERGWGGAYGGADGEVPTELYMVGNSGQHLAEFGS